MVRALTAMGFGERASRRACVRVGLVEASSHRQDEALLGEAISWLASEEAEAVVEEAAEEEQAEAEAEVVLREDHEEALALEAPRPAESAVRAQPMARPNNRWAALMDEEVEVD